MDERERLIKAEQAAGLLVSGLRDILKHTENPPKMESDNSDLVLQAVMLLGQRLTTLEEKVGEIHQVILAQRVQKEWYTTNELAEALDKSHFTIQERWCNDGRIECEKDPNSGKWLIPGQEYRRLVGGGALKPKRR